MAVNDSMPSGESRTPEYLVGYEGGQLVRVPVGSGQHNDVNSLATINSSQLAAGATGVAAVKGDGSLVGADGSTITSGGGYIKPGSGIPLTDMSAAVQTAITAGATALQQATADGRYVRTVNGTAPDGSGNVVTAGGTVTAASITDASTPGRNLLTAATVAVQRTQLGLGTAAVSDTTAFATAAQGAKADTALQIAPVTSVAGKQGAVSLVVADILNAQPMLESGLTIKTVNGNNLLGPGDITISGSGGTVTAASITDSSAAGRALLTAADASAQRTALGLGTAALSAAGDFATAAHSHTIGGVTGLQAALDAKIGAPAPVTAVTAYKTSNLNGDILPNQNITASVTLTNDDTGAVTGGSMAGYYTNTSGASINLTTGDGKVTALAAGSSALVVRWRHRADSAALWLVSGGAAAAPAAATAITMTGPTTSTVGAASAAFTVGADGAITGSITVTPTTVAGLTFVPTSVTLTSGSPTATFTATAASAGSRSVAVTNSASLTNPSAITLVSSVAAATAVTLTGPTTSAVGAASAAYTVGADGTITGTVVVTPTPVAGVTFTPTSVSISAGTPTATFTATVAAASTVSVAVTNNGGLTNPSAISLTASAGATVPGAPTGLTLGTTAATTQGLTWTAPASNGGSAITGYRVGYRTPQGSGAYTYVNTGSATAAFTLTGLTDSTPYDIVVDAVNAIGAGADSAAVQVTTSAGAGALPAAAVAAQWDLNYGAGGASTMSGAGLVTPNATGASNLAKLAAYTGDFDVAFRYQAWNTSSGNGNFLAAVANQSDAAAASVCGLQIIQWLPRADSKDASGSTANQAMSTTAANNIMRLKRVSGVIRRWVSNDGGGSWIQVGASVNSSAALYIRTYADNGSAATQTYIMYAS